MTPAEAGRADRDRVVVVGASVSGMIAALALANRDVPVELVDADPELDATDAAADVAPAVTGRSGPSEASRRRPRRATPQAGHSHAFLARCRALLAAEAPDALAGLLAAGCREVALAEQRPPTVPLHAAARGDADFVVLAARRTTYESVLRTAVRRRSGAITLTPGRRATGLLIDRAGADAIPRVEGVAFDDRSVSRSRLVIDASGRRTPMPGWLADQGITVADESSECGITYLTRFYQRTPDAPPLPLNRGFAAGGSFDSYSCLVFPGDAGTFSATFGLLPEDRDLRALRDEAAFNAAVRSIPSLAPWVDADHADAISDVRTMAGLVNRIRRVSAGGGPGLPGWTAVGDAAATTNPAHSRGCTLGAIHAVAIADAVAEHGSDAAGLAEACAAVVEAEQAPWVADSIEQDHQRLSRWRPAPPSDAPADAAPLGRAGRLGRLTNGETWAAAQHDAYVWRRFTRLQQLFDQPDDVLADPRVVARVRAVQAARPASPPLGGPSHAELVELVGATAPVA
jgi:2-polyprenyl-6-methoxyphenol hydroxylase-like FAD-dependent oxidoreductase